jgi:putative toxin-antitoxin system antitoxin component (TIGR02293 family)
MIRPEELERNEQLTRITVLAKQYLGGNARAIRWFQKPNQALGGSTPLELIDTERSARAVENVLGRIAFGGIS